MKLLGRPAVLTLVAFSVATLAARVEAVSPKSSAADAVFDLGPAYHRARDVAIAGSSVVTGDEFGLALYEVDADGTLTLRGSVALPGEAVDVDVAGGLAAAAMESRGVALISLADPAEPTVLWTWDPVVEVTEVHLLAGRLVSANETTAWCHDLATPASPTLAWTASGLWPPKAWSDDLLVTARYPPGFRVYRHRVDAPPELVSTFDSGSTIVDFTLVGSRMVALTSLGWLTVVDLSNPAAPAQVTQTLMHDAFTVAGTDHASTVVVATPQGAVRWVAVSGDRVGEVVGEAVLPSRATAVDGSGDAVAALAGSINANAQRLYLLTLGDSPSIGPSVPLDNMVLGVRTFGQLLAVHSMRELALLEPTATSLRLVGKVDFGLPTTRAAYQSYPPFFAGSLACLPRGERGVSVVDVADPSQPVVRAVVESGFTFNRALTCAIGGNVLTVARSDGSLWSADISELAAVEVLADDLVGSGDLVSMVIDDTVLWVFESGWQPAVHTFELVPAGAPVYLGATAADSYLGPSVHWSHWLASSGGRGLEIFDVSAPTSPVRVVQQDEPEPLGRSDLAVSRGLVYGVSATEQADDVGVVDARQPQRPRWAGQLANGEEIISLAVSDDGSSLWVASSAQLARYSLARAACGLMSAAAEDVEIAAGGSTVLTVELLDLTLQPIAGQGLSASADRGQVSSFVDLGAGRYEAVLEPGDELGPISVHFSLNGDQCQEQDLELTVVCAQPRPVPSGLTISRQSTTAVELCWDADSRATSFSLYRGDLPIGTAGATSSPCFVDDHLGLGAAPCYRVAPTDRCGVEQSPSPPVCAPPPEVELSCPAHVTTVALGPPAISAATSLGNAMLVADAVGLARWDLSQPTAPRRAAEWRPPRPVDSPTSPVGVGAAGGGLAAAWFDHHLILLDCRAPEQLRPIWEHAFPGQVKAVFPGSGASLALIHTDGSSERIQVLDLSNPFVPRLAASRPNRFDSNVVGREGILIGYEWFSSSLEVWDFADPARLHLVGSLDLSSYHVGGFELWSLGSLVLLKRWHSDPFGMLVDTEHIPRVVWSDGGPPAFASVVATARSGDVGYLLSIDQQLFAVDLADPSHPTEIASRPLGVEVIGLEAFADHVVVVSASDGILTLDAATLETLAASPTTVSMSRLKMEGDVAIAVDDDRRLVVLDVANPDAPTVAVSIDLGEPIRSVELAGRTAMVATDEEVQLFDLERPFSLAPIATVELRVLLAAGGPVMVGVSGLDFNHPAVYDISDPYRPTHVANLDSWLYHQGDIAGGLGVFGASDAFIVADLDPPAAATITALVDLSDLSAVAGTATNGPLAVVSGWNYNPADSNSRIVIASVADPVHPAVVDSLPIAAWRLDDAGSTVVGITRVGDADRAFLLETAVPSGEREIHLYQSSASVDSVEIEGSRMYVLGRSTLEVASLTCGAPSAGFQWTATGTEHWFEDTSAGWVESWHWDFGDGVTSSDRHPHHRFPAPGAYTVELETWSRHGVDRHVERIVVELVDEFLDRTRGGGVRVSP